MILLDCPVCDRALRDCVCATKTVPGLDHLIEGMVHVDHGMDDSGHARFQVNLVDAPRGLSVILERSECMEGFEGRTDLPHALWELKRKIKSEIHAMVADGRLLHISGIGWHFDDVSALDIHAWKAKNGDLP